MNNCNLTTCRYNNHNHCTNLEKRTECIEVSKAVLCENSDFIEDKVKFISDGIGAMLYINGEKVRCTDIYIDCHVAKTPMVGISATWLKYNEDGTPMMNEDETALQTEGLRINW
jgi:hypothetical protein